MTTSAGLWRLFQSHIDELQKRAARLLERENLELLAIHSGQQKRWFLDDMNYPFRANPHFKAWCPETQLPNAWIIVQPKTKPTLVLLAADDFWHTVKSVESEDWTAAFHVEHLKTPEAIETLLPYDKKHAAYIGEHIEVAKALGFENINPDPVLHFFHYHRLFKTDYELACLEEANELAARGHIAAAEAFAEGASEFECLLSYMSETKQGQNEVPYSHIIGQNENASVLHHWQLATANKTPLRSMLVDAGAEVCGYAADISRTWSYEHNEYEELIVAVDQITLALIDKLKPGVSFPDLHKLAHEQIANLLFAFGFVRCSPEQMIEEGITTVFFPHGLGHPLGLQVHDVGAAQADERGTPIPSPQGQLTLRTTRTVEARQVYTIEPGIYFIEPLLNKLASSNKKHLINWKRVDEFRPFGGVRIEDNIVVYREKNDNLTRRTELKDFKLKVG
ncbi:Xaa-Pro dipeptidase [Idiomarina piscisalsi]|uniref:Xaa-Pro dipeptidase n=1 Tax=Idiomarina piscisalsi TaxID=1096243 RepID=A0A432YS56_9GAMM|nr:Xaa-Pro dipeptidase [Idiomarina piscisalsi]RUO64412.1 Xaa-Pro dipeptidase [Idiomarina piscisalsi]